MLIDSHCHLNYLDNPEEAVERAKEAGVTSCLCISVDEAGFSGVKALATRYANIWATAGVHPDAAGGNLEWIEAELAHERVVAVGETGLDYLHADNASAQARQREAFALQLCLGVRHNMPVWCIPVRRRKIPWTYFRPIEVLKGCCIALRSLGRWQNEP